MGCCNFHTVYISSVYCIKQFLTTLKQKNKQTNSKPNLQKHSSENIVSSCSGFQLSRTQLNMSNPLESNILFVCLNSLQLYFGSFRVGQAWYTALFKTRSKQDYIQLFILHLPRADKQLKAVSSTSDPLTYSISFNTE